MSSTRRAARLGRRRGLQRRRRVGVQREALEREVLRLTFAAERERRRNRGKVTRDERRAERRERDLLAKLREAEGRLTELSTMLGRGELRPQDFATASQAAREQVDALTHELAEAGSSPRRDFFAEQPVHEALNRWEEGLTLSPQDLAHVQELIVRELGEGKLHVKAAAPRARFTPDRLVVRD